MDNPVSWVVLTIIIIILLLYWFIHHVNAKNKKSLCQMEYDQDLVFFD